MPNIKNSFILFIIPLIAGCESARVDFQQNNCKVLPAFVRNTAGFNPAKSYFSTSEIRTMGLVLIEQGEPARYYRHPSWSTGGWLAAIALDNKGNVYVAPAAFINMLNNPLSSQNTIYKVDAVSGKMEPFLELPAPDSVNNNNPYGIIGLAFLCESETLYASTVLGSDRYHERGGLYAIDVKTKKIISSFRNKDVMGMGISYITGERRLFFGSGRSSSVYSIALNKKGQFIGAPRTEFSIAGIGARGDDKVRKIEVDDYGHLQIHGIEFNYNLIAPREKQEGIYTFRYNSDSSVWAYTPAY